MRIAVVLSFHAGHRKSNAGYMGREAEHWSMLEAAAMRINAVEKFTTIVCSIARDRLAEPQVAERLRPLCGDLIFTGSDEDVGHQIGAVRAIKCGFDAAKAAGCEWVFFTQEDLLFESENPARYWVECAIARDVEYYGRPCGDDVGRRDVGTQCFTARTSALDDWHEANFTMSAEAFLTLHFRNHRIRYAREWSMSYFHTHSIPEFFDKLRKIGDRERPIETFKFRHGLGDAVQVTAVLRHLRAQGRRVAIAAKTGKHTAFHGLCEKVIDCDREQVPVDAVEIPWPEGTAYPDTLQTKTTRCLREFFHIEPRLELLGYEILPTPENFTRAVNYLRGLGATSRNDGRFNAVALHYEGNTAKDKKNVGCDVIREVVAGLHRRGIVPFLLDWDNRSPLPGEGVACPDKRHSLWGGTGTGDANMLAALISCCSGFVGIDSGPLHVAAATATPSVGLWTKHAPIRYIEPCLTMLHLVPDLGNDLQRSLYRLRRYDALTGEIILTALDDMGCLPERK